MIKIKNNKTYTSLYLTEEMIDEITVFISQLKQIYPKVSRAAVMEIVIRRGIEKFKEYNCGKDELMRISWNYEICDDVVARFEELNKTVGIIKASKELGISRSMGVKIQKYLKEKNKK